MQKNSKSNYGDFATIKTDMNKIIELAEKLSNLAVGGNYVTMLVTRNKLNKAIAERKQLEQTPITEEWLKEHGWEEDIRHYEWTYWYNDKKQFISLIISNDECILEDTSIVLNSLADLYDVVELCGIDPREMKI